MIHSLEKAAQTLDCVDPIRADTEVKLNTIHSKDPLMLSISSLYTSDIIPTLVDSGSSHCFIDSAFVLGHDLPVSDVALKKLRLFDGTYSTIIMQETDLPAKFPSGEPYLLGFWSLCWIHPAPPFLDTTGLPTTPCWLTGLSAVSPYELLFKTLLFRC